MNQTIRIYCRNFDRHVDVAGGETLLEVFNRLDPEAGEKPVCALVNNKVEDLHFPIYAPKQVEYLLPTSEAGRRVIVRSLCMMLYKAVTTLPGEHGVRIEHSISNGYFCRLLDRDNNPAEISADTIRLLKQTMSRLQEEDIPFESRELPTPEAIELFRKANLTEKVGLLETIGRLYTKVYFLGDTADSYDCPLAPSTGLTGAFDLRPYKDGMLLMAADPANPAVAARPVRQAKMFEAFMEHQRFNRVTRVASIGSLNRAVEQGHAADLINVAEAMHNKLLGKIADTIRDRRRDGGARIVLMAGPSSSGKTTSGKRLGIQLMTNLMTPRLISLDDYFVDRAHTPKDESGDYDYESLYALDLEQFNTDLRRLLDGEEINLPTYSFELGRRIEKERPFRLEPDDVLLIEGIHGLNPELTAALPPECLFKVYVSALTTLRIDNHNWISTSDTRLLRRIVRDYKYRHTSPLDSIRRWPSVRRGEEKWIFPFQENADATFNSSLIFELGVMKEYAAPLLADVPHTAPEYAVAHRLANFLGYFRAIPADQVPPTSLLREFLGGSSFHY